MTDNPRPPHPDPEHSGTGMTAAGIGAALAMIACCGAPALAATGILGAIGGYLGNPRVITAAAAVLVAAVAILVWRRRAGRADCCPPSATTGRRDHRDHARRSSKFTRR